MKPVHFFLPFGVRGGDTLPMLIASRYQARMAEPGRDEDILARLKIACWQESYDQLLPADILKGMSLERTRATWRHSLQHGIAWIAEQGGAPVGFGHMRGDEITMLYVLASDQGHGLGCELLLHLFEEIACFGHRKAHLWVLAENHKARRFYARMGGTADARRPVGFANYPDIMEVRYNFDIGG
ncbi:GNAT family N-acetyltransferase [Parvibaculum sp.]|uniref:GNAT family N-acetyltransferase n=1 Tax=Parvibaculum sp. TaxID=2024848 RepID=UPI000C8A1A98|nr:GNAT family N-acetyltransferase [Parvibaculum sp.]MAB13418.1 hypothetical protein [Parvibaculum sp.]